jgi:rhodanese-related sulfurtransferase
MKFTHALVFYAIFIAVVMIVAGGFVFKRTTSDVSPLWLTPQEAKKLIDQAPDVVLIDLSRNFYSNGHLPGALNYTKCAISEVISNFNKNKTYIFYCHGAGAPLSSAYKMKQAGFLYTYALAGNYGAWLNAGYPVEN